MDITTDATNERSFRVTSGPFTFAYTDESDAIEVSTTAGDGSISITPGGTASGFDVLRPENVDSITVDESGGATVVITGRIEAGRYGLTLRFPRDCPGLLHYRLSVTTGDEPVSLPTGTPELAVEGDDLDPESSVVDYLAGTPDSDPAAGTGDTNEFLFLGFPDVLDATLLAAVDYGALDDYFAATGTEMFDVVTEPPGPFGYEIPVGEGQLSADATVVVSANVLRFTPEVPSIDEPVAYAKRFVTDLADVYDRIGSPDTERVDWPEIAEAAARDLERPENRHEHDGVWHPGGVELVSTMSVGVPFRRYADAFDSSRARSISASTEVAIPTYHDDEFRTASGSGGTLSNDPAPADLSHADAWYYLWGLIQVGEYARETGSQIATEAFLDSADVVVDVARAVDYVFPRWLDVERLDGIESSSAGGGFQYDCTGAYVHLALQYHEMTGESRYLDEAKAAADSLLEFGFEYPYELSTTAVGPAALRRLHEETGDERYIDGSYIPLAAILRHTHFFDLDHGEFAGRQVFLLNDSMPVPDAEGNYYANAFEEDALLTYLGRYLREGFDDLAPAARDLVGELLRHKGTSLADALAPLQSDASMIADSVSPQSGRRVDPDWYLPLEPFGLLGPRFDELGAIAQTLYGTGAFATAATMQYHELSDDLTLYTECPVAFERDGPYAHEVRAFGGDRKFDASLLGSTDAVVDLAVRDADSSQVDLLSDRDGDGYGLELRGGRRYRFERTVSRRAVVTERLDVSPQTVEPGEPFEVTIDYRNTSSHGGHYETKVQIGTAEEPVSMVLDAGDTEREVLTTAIDEPGTHMVQAQRTRCRLDVDSPE